MERPVGYRSYLVRVWPRRGGAEYTVTVESVATGARVTLPDLASLVAFLTAPIDNHADRPAGTDGAHGNR